MIYVFFLFFTCHYIFLKSLDPQSFIYRSDLFPESKHLGEADLLALGKDGCLAVQRFVQSGHLDAWHG